MMVIKKLKNKKFFSGWKAAPLQGSFMVIAIVGFFVSAYYILPQSTNFGLASIMVFIMMFIASMISMTKGPIIRD